MIFNNLLILFSIAFPISIAFFNLQRRRPPNNLRLVPNCLISKRPIIFIPGRTSPFLFGQYFHHGPQILKEHGYEVMELSLPKRKRMRQLKLNQFLAQNPNMSAIYILDQETLIEFEEVFLKLEGSSYCLISPNSSERFAFRCLQFLQEKWKFLFRDNYNASLFCFESPTAIQQLINRVIFFAEEEWTPLESYVEIDSKCNPLKISKDL